jgi:predicted nucleotidyltransferase
MVSNATIQAMVDRIVERFRPERVVLFGSYARGEATEDSDVDLLVEFERDPREDRWSDPIRRALVDDFVVPTDLVVCTREMVDKYRDNPYSLIHHAFAEGRVLYEKRTG